MNRYTYFFKVNGRYLTYYNYRDNEMRLSDNINNVKIFQGQPKTQLKRLLNAFDIDKIEVLELAIQEKDCFKTEAEAYLPKSEKEEIQRTKLSRN
ncbi:hypothetical protein QNI16_34320 [Cytophagaceae bacterium YF14B1]|uniref:Uncharacterized protein n=1 Tax=Xanthocytophaga flava TaxID=3048013 RepID=A0AAE3QUG2_9BACT|nr:hypothetical protein [Xanthocytophaga flavus]MDJ1485617.1 hypothetical protein [Xanthocytophaga flavus]